MQKQVQKQVKGQVEQGKEEGDEGDHQPCLCDGCDRLIEEDLYIQHWEKCIEDRRCRERELRLKRETEASKKEEMERERTRERERVNSNCQKCGAELGNSLANHNLVCSWRDVECQFCGEQFPASLLTDHQNQCEVKATIEASMKEQSQTHSSVNNQRTMPVRQRRYRQDRGVSTRQQGGYIPGQMSAFIHSHARNRNNNSSQSAQIQASNESRDRSGDLLEDFYNVMRGAKEKLSEEEIRTFDRKPYQQDMHKEQQKCSICFQFLIENEEVMVLRCSHLFHSNCLGEWLRKAVTCPNCNERLKPNR